VESLVNLTVSVDQVRVVYREHIIDGDVDVDAGKTILILEEGHFDGWNVAKSAFLRHLFDDLAAVFDKLVLVVGHPTVKYDDDINV
jgi:hypothetical protein